jgi:hypothetical protein
MTASLDIRDGVAGDRPDAAAFAEGGRPVAAGRAALD